MNIKKIVAIGKLKVAVVDNLDNVMVIPKRLIRADLKRLNLSLESYPDGREGGKFYEDL